MKDYFGKAIEYGNLRRALNKCCRGIRWKDSVVGYELHAVQNTYKLRQDLLNGTYKLSPYQTFTVHEPKEREIVATRIRDRQVQMALCDAGLYDDICEHFIYDNCACQRGKGTDFTLKRVRAHMSKFFKANGKDGWVLKCDVRHFFPNTRHDVAKAAIANRVEDPRAREYVSNVIDSFGGDKGIGLGSQISQLVELAVLDDLDHYIKERLRIRHYVRYMDDMILFHPDKEYLQFCKAEIERKLNEIGLELNKKTTIYPLRQGVKFLQWRFVITDTGKINMKLSGKKMGKQRRKLKKIIKKEITGEYPAGSSANSLTAWRANAIRGDAYYQQQRMKNYYYQTKAEVKNDYRKRENPEAGTRSMACDSEGGSQCGQDRLQHHDGDSGRPI